MRSSKYLKVEGNFSTGDFDGQELLRNQLCQGDDTIAAIASILLVLHVASYQYKENLLSKYM